MKEILSKISHGATTEQNVFSAERAMIDDDTRSATVSAREDSDFLVNSKDDFPALGNNHPGQAYRKHER